MYLESPGQPNRPKVDNFGEMNANKGIGPSQPRRYAVLQITKVLWF